MDGHSSWNWSDTWLHHEGDTVILKLPDSVVSESSMRKSSLGPPAVIEADVAVGIGHVGGCRLYHVSADVRAQCSFLALLHDKAVNVAHDE